MGNADLIREGYATFNRGDWDQVPAFFSVDAVLDTSVSFVGPLTYAGREGAREFIDSIEAMFEQYTAVPIELVERGEFVMAVTDLEGRLRVSGRRVSAREVQLWTVRDGAIVGLRIFHDRADAERAMADDEQARPAPA